MSNSEDELQAEILKEQGSVIQTHSKVSAPGRKVNPLLSTDVEEHSGLRIKRRIVSTSKCKTGLQNVEFVPIQNVEHRTKQYFSIHVGVKPSKDWGTIGVVDKCVALSDFSVTRITDMRGSFLNLYITGKAFAQNQNHIGMGSIIAIKRPFLLKPTETHHSIGLHVDQLQQMWVIGQSMDLAQCSSYVRKDVRCTEWTDIRSGDYCDKHLERVCNFSKNGRMELAGGDSGFDIRWATQKRQSDGSILYESKRERRVDPMLKLFSSTSKSGKDREAYYLKGKGLVAVDGTLIQKTAPPKREPTAAEKQELTEFLKGRRDPGAEMIRKIKGIKEDSPRTVLSKEALDKMGIGIKSLTKEEEQAKKRSFEALSKASDKDDDGSQKKPRYVYL
ncbi:uncharacterized protein ATC70_004877 [Mucor velutinosus]|uniref:Zinc finger Mcm10/DnaG-type domain-containing protein n=1 Tax=Mucor velutinosus TaxID=708070 RepID=A0AAN7D4W6_9FUNG|nr:hypothetical protein ATC70_004877 [Mucor velutinosus]